MDVRATACTAQVVELAIPELELARVAHVVVIGAEMALAHRPEVAVPALRKQCALKTACLNSFMRLSLPAEAHTVPGRLQRIAVLTARVATLRTMLPVSGGLMSLPYSVFCDQSCTEIVSCLK